MFVAANSGNRRLPSNNLSTSCPSGHWNTAFQDPGANHLSWFGSNPIPSSVARFLIQKSFRTSEAAVGRMSHYTAGKALTCCRCSRSFFNLIAKILQVWSWKTVYKKPALCSSTCQISKSQEFWTSRACTTIASVHYSCSPAVFPKLRLDQRLQILCFKVRLQQSHMQIDWCNLGMTLPTQPQSSLKLPYHVLLVIPTVTEVPPLEYSSHQRSVPVSSHVHRHRLDSSLLPAVPSTWPPAAPPYEVFVFKTNALYSGNSTWEPKCWFRNDNLSWNIANLGLTVSMTGSL